MANNDLEALVLTISADTRQIKRALDRLDSDVNRSTNNIERKFTGAKRSMDAFAASVSGMGRGLLAGLGVGFAAQDFLKTVQSVDSLGSSLKAITGDSDAAAREMKFLTETSERLGLEVVSAGQAYASLLAATKGTTLEGEEARRVFEAVSSAMSSLGKSSDDTQSALLAIQQMISKGTVSSEELRGQLGERLPGAFRLAAQALGVTEQELGKLLEKGVVPATELIPRLTDKLVELYGTDRKSTLTAEINRLNNSITELYKTMAETGAISAMVGAATQLRDIVKELSVYYNLIANGRIGDAFAVDQRGVADLKMRLGQGSSLTDAQSAEWDKAFGMSGGSPTQVTVNRGRPAFKPSSSGGARETIDAYERMTRMIQERTQALQYETSVQATLNPLVNDYGFAMEKARAEADLLNAAERAKIEITPEVRQNIDALATAYAEATVESERLREQQEHLVDQLADLNDLGKDVLGGFITDMQNGVSAAEALANALAKVGDKLLGMALDSLFPSGGSGGGLFGALLGGFADGGYTGPGGKYQPAGVVHKGEYVIPADRTRELGLGFLDRLAGYADGGFVAPALPNIGRAALSAGTARSAGSTSVPISITIDARGADESGLSRVQQQLAQLRSDIPRMVVTSVANAKRRNVQGI